jgi:hypothetical protein
MFKFKEYRKKHSIPMIKDGRILTTEGKYADALKSRTVESVRYVMQDAADAFTSFPEGKNATFYAAEVRLCLAELVSRLRSR